MRWAQIFIVFFLLAILPSIVLGAPEDDDDGDGSINRYDCDDTNPNIYPGNTEICNGIDDNCDALVDDTFSCSAQKPFCGGTSGCVECTQNDQCASNICSENTCVLFPCSVVNECGSISDTGCSSDSNRKWTCVLGDLRSDGTRCLEKEYTYCSDEGMNLCSSGSCYLACDAHVNTPGCQKTAPQNSVSVVDKRCAQEGYSCYTCPDGMLWRNGMCEDRGVVIENVQDVWIEQGETLVLSPITVNNNDESTIDALYAYEGLFSKEQSGTAQFVADTIGTHTLTITAYTLVGTAKNELVSTTIKINVFCPADVPCCPQGEPRYAQKGALCAMDAVQGICDAKGSCRLHCEKSPENTLRACTDGEDNDCDGIADCSLVNGKTESGCADFCQTYCALPLRACEDACIDVQTDHDNCGRCGTQCGKQEICEAGSCQKYDGCFVACSNDADCGGICKNAGTCQAFCQSPTTLQVSEQHALLALLAKEQTIALQKELTQETLSFSLLNLVGTPLTDVQVLITLPNALRDVIGDAKNSHSYERLNDGATLRFTFSSLSGKEVITFSGILQELKPFVTQISTAISHASFDVTQAALLTSQDAVFVIDASLKETQTLLTVSVIPQKKITDLRVPIKIPTCANAVPLSSSEDIIQVSDTLFVLTKEVLAQKEEVQFLAASELDDSCIDDVHVFGLGTASSPINPAIILLLIPLLGFLVFLVHHFYGGESTEHLSKKEFVILGQEQGQSKEEIERSWHEYKRKF